MAASLIELEGYIFNTCAEKLTVNAAQLSSCAISDTLMREMRSSAIFLGAILARCGRAEISYPGGCEA